MAGIYVRTEERRKEISERVKKAKHWENPEFRRKQIETHNTPEYIKKHSEKVKELWKNQEYRKKHSEGVKKSWQNPEYRKKHVDKITLEYKLKKSKDMKKYWQNPEVRKNNTINGATILTFWRRAVRKRVGDKCEYCGLRTNLVAHHIFSIRHANTKWDMDNGICLCTGHHTYNSFSAHGSPEFTLWIINYIGKKRYEKIRDKANQIKKWTEPEKWELYWELKKYVGENLIYDK